MGKMHIGGIKTALVNYLFAKKHGGEFILRIEDTDEKRFDPDAEKYILDALKWMNITPDHGPTFGDGRFGPYRQSERNYRPFADKLLKEGHAYYAFDTDDELNAVRKAYEGSKKPFSYDRNTRMSMRNSLSLSKSDVDSLLESGVPYTIRFRMPDEPVDVLFTDLVRGTVAFNTSILDDKVLFKSNGVPTYHLAATSDDYAMGITHVFRGEEWLSSTPLHLLIYDAMGWKAPEFAHLPLLLDSNGAKMSKRNAITKDEPIFPFTVEVKDDDGTVLGISTGLKERGYDPDALINYLALLGWHPKDDREIMSFDELVNAFDINDVNNSGARFDPAKAAHFNKAYLSKREGKSFIHLLPENVFGYSEESLSKIAKAGFERVSFAKDIPSMVDYFFKDVDPPVANMKELDDFASLLDRLIGFIAGSDWNPNAVESFAVADINENGLNRGPMLNNLRLSLTGGASGPKLHEMMDMMGRDESLRRFNKAKERIALLHTAG